MAAQIDGPTQEVGLMTAVLKQKLLALIVALAADGHNPALEVDDKFDISIQVLRSLFYGFCICRRGEHDNHNGILALGLANDGGGLEQIQ